MSTNEDGFVSADHRWRGPKVEDSLGISDCWEQLLAAPIAWPDRMVGTPLALTIRSMAFADPDAVIAHVEREENAAAALCGAITSGRLKVYVAPIEGPFERLVDHQCLEGITASTFVAGFYHSDKSSWLYGRPLFIKSADWKTWLDALPTSSQAQGTNNLERACERWLEAQFSAGRAGNRRFFFDTALEEFPGLGRRQFERAWRRPAEKFGRNKAGRPKGKSTQ